jgi:hypothetical protein
VDLAVVVVAANGFGQSAASHAAALARLVDVALANTHTATASGRACARVAPGSRDAINIILRRIASAGMVIARVRFEQVWARLATLGAGNENSPMAHTSATITLLRASAPWTPGPNDAITWASFLVADHRVYHAGTADATMCAFNDDRTTALCGASATSGSACAPGAPATDLAVDSAGVGVASL